MPVFLIIKWLLIRGKQPPQTNPPRRILLRHPALPLLMKSRQWNSKWLERLSRLEAILLAKTFQPHVGKPTFQQISIPVSSKRVSPVCAHASDICYVQVEILYKLQIVPKACTSCNLYKQFIQVATRTKLAVQIVTCTEFYYQKTQLVQCCCTSWILK